MWRKKKVKLSGLAEEFLLHVEVNNTSARTPYNYHWRLKLFLEKYGDISPKELRKIHLLKLKKEVEDSGRYAASSVDAIAQGVKAFCNWLFDEGYLEKSVSSAIHRSVVKERPNAGPVSLDVAQVALSRAQTKRDKAIMLFLIDTGARRGEIVSTRLPLLDLDKMTAVVNGKVGERIVTYINRSRLAVIDYIQNERPSVKHDYLFCNVRRPYGPMGGQSLYMLIKKLARGMDGFTHPHAYRHLVANEYAHAEGGGVNLAQQKMGHADIKTTMIYVHTDIRHLQKQDSQLSVLNLLE